MEATNILIPTRDRAKFPLGLRPVSLATVAKTPMSSAIDRYLERATNLRTQVYYDTVRLAAGTPWAKGQTIKLFSRGREQDGKVANTGAVFTKSDFDTNMVGAGGEFEGNVSVIVMAFEAMHIPLPVKAAAAVNGMITDPTANATQPAGYSATLLELALMTQTKYTFERGTDTREENGLLIDIPSSSGLSGSFAAQANEVLVQNTMGHNRMLDFPKVVHSEKPFDVLIEPLADTLAIPVDCAIRFRMVCKRIRED